MAGLFVRDITIGEGDAFADVVVRLDAMSTSAISVQYVLFDGTALSPPYGSFDYFDQSDTLHFAPGETTKTVRVQLRNDTEAEGPERFWFGLSNATNATISRPWATVSVFDNDTIVDMPQLYVGDLLVDEKQSTASFVVRLGNQLGNSSNATISVGYATQDGTAVAGQDFVARSGTLSFAPGESVKTVVVDLIDDTLAEPLERFNLVLSSPVNAAIGDGAAVAEIGSSDGTGSSQPRISVGDVTASEGDGYVDLAIGLHAPSTSVISVQYVLSDGTALSPPYGSFDYFDQSDTLHFAPGETTKTVRVQLRNDTEAEGPERFWFGLSNATNATISSSAAQITILDDDGGGRPLLSQGRSNDIYVIDTSAVDFLEAANGGFDVVRSSTSFTLPVEMEGIILTGNALNATGNESANFFLGNASTNTIDGRGGIDTVALLGRDVDYTITGNTFSRSASRSGEGTDTLLSIERLQFVNTVMAFDTSPGENTWGAFALLNAAFDAHPSPALLGQWTTQLDQLGGMDELARAMIQYYAPGVSNEVLVAHLWSTVVELPLKATELSTFVGLIESGSFTQASLTVLAATHTLNTDEFAHLTGQPMLMDPAWFPLPGG